MRAKSAEGSTIHLSRREQEIAGLVAQGLTNREIAERLFISERTVDGHLEHVREKLGVNTRAQVAAWIVRQEADGAPAAAGSESVPRPAPRWRLVVHPRLWLAIALVLALLAAGVGMLRLTAPPEPTIETIAGSACFHQTWPGGCKGGDGHLATSAYLARPTDVAIDTKGLVYIADFGNQLVRVVDGNGIITTVAGGGNKPLSEGVLATAANLGSPSSVAVDSENRLLILTRSGNTVGVWRVDTPFMHLVVPLHSSTDPRVLAPLGPNMPVGGLAVTKDETIYVSDPAGSRVWKFAAGSLSVYAGSGDSSSPLGDNGAATSARLAWPVGLALDKHENLYIADALDNRIRRVDARSHAITTVAGSGTFEGDTGDGGPALQASLSFPFGVAVAADGAIVIADTGNHRLRTVTTQGIINGLAGTGRWGFVGDHTPAIDAELNGPEGVRFNARGDLFIADTENQRVREIAALSSP